MQPVHRRAQVTKGFVVFGSRTSELKVHTLTDHFDFWYLDSRVLKRSSFFLMENLHKHLNNFRVKMCSGMLLDIFQRLFL